MHLFLQYSPRHSKENTIHDKPNQSTYLVGAEFGVVQLSNSIGHVFFAHKFYNTGSISENVGVADVPCLAHVVLQVLPAATLGKSCNRQVCVHACSESLMNVGSAILVFPSLVLR